MAQIEPRGNTQFADDEEIQKAFERILEDSQNHYLAIEKRAKNPPRRPEWMRTLFGTLRRRHGS